VAARGAPASTSACMIGTVDSRSGSPAVKYGMSALRLAALSLVKVAGIRDMYLLTPHPGPLPQREREKRCDALRQEIRSTLPREATGKLCSPRSQLDPRMLRHRVHVLVATPGKIYQQYS